MRLFRSATHERIPVGRYRCTETDLYWIEETIGDRAVIEDCRTGTLIDVPLAFVHRLQPLPHAAW